MFDGEAFGAEIVAHVRSHVSNSIAPLLQRIDDLEHEIKLLIARPSMPGPRGEPGKPGKDADQLLIAKMVAEEVKKIPSPKDGKDGASITGPPGPPGQSGESIIGPPGPEGVGIASAFIDRDGNLVLTFTDGTVGSVGKVVGGEGPPGKNGTDGKDGRDGFGFEDMSASLLDDGHTVELKFVRGELMKTFEVVFPNSKYCNIWVEDRDYMTGDLVTWAGSMWHCNSPTKDKPGSGSTNWTLATKRGRDGKDGRDGGMGPPGPTGPRGRDLTQMDFSGAKF